MDSVQDGVDSYREVAAAGWRWVLDQVQWDEGPWIPTSVPWPDNTPAPTDRDGLHSGIGGLAHVLGEVRLARVWTDEEAALAAAIGDRLRAGIASKTDATWFDGLAGDAGALLVLDTDAAAEAFARLEDLATPDGWPQRITEPPRFLPGARINDVTLGTAGVLRAASAGVAHNVPGARAVAEHAADVLLAEAEPILDGLNWKFVPERFRTTPATEMPNWSHGLAGIAAALADAGAGLGRADLLAAATSGAEHLLTLAVPCGAGLVVPRYAPEPLPDEEPWSFGWCHGSAGTSQLFASLQHAGVAAVAGERPARWRRRFLASVVSSGVPERVRPGFWDNDGRCCGTAGVGEIFLDAWCDRGPEASAARDLVFARRLGDAVVERAVHDQDGARWRFVDHLAQEPLLAPGTGWMQGAAGIARFLMRLDRLIQSADAPPLRPSTPERP